MSDLKEHLLQAAREALALELGGLTGAALSLAVCAAAKPGRTLLVITPGPESADTLHLDVQSLLPEIHAPVAPSLEAEHPERTSDWLSFLSRLSGRAPELVITPVAGLLELLPQPGQLASSRMEISPGSELDLDALLARLIEAGYQRVDQVEEPGQFARRGGIADLFPPTRGSPLRIELFGRRVESLRAFDPATQRSFEAIQEPVAFPLVEAHQQAESSLFDYLPQAQLACLEPALCMERLHALGAFAGDDPGRAARISATRERLSGPGVLRLGEAPAAVNWRCIAPVNLGQGYEGMATLLRALGESPVRILLFCGTETEQRLTAEGLKGHGLAAGPGLALLPGDIEGGRVLPDLGFALLSVHELLGRARRRQAAHEEAPRDLAEVLDDFLELEPGDYVVHLQHGIARLKGIERLTRDGRSGEFLSLEFAEGTVLHVPVTNADVVQKYIGARGQAPALSRLHSSAWSERKLRAQQSVLRLASDMLELNALRAQEAGHASRPDGLEMADYEAACPFRDTPDQAVAGAAIKRDMESRRPMDRLLCGDVGYGKTELAMRAAFKMVLEGRQVAVLAPTTVLAQQHYLTFSERLQHFPVNIEVLSRFRTGAQQRDVVTRLAEGRVDIVIGTHRLLSQDVQFRNLGLVIIDEEQRFGVEHKERLKRMRATVDLLTLSATPIPRTLQQALLGLRDISNLTTPPENRLPVITRAMHWNDRELADAIRREMARDGQVYFVHNRVYDIEVVARRVQALAPEARLAIGHGQMPEGELEDVMLRFMNREVDVLVCTTIIESGIDVRTANTIVIDNAHHYGLADLHQLRGRVGRYHHQAHCYLLVPEDVNVSEVAGQRLRAILQYQALGSGFRIAMRDLELRGAGNLLGPEQSGHIASVGYDLYCRLLDRAVRKLRHQPVPPEVDTQLDLGLELTLPREYVSAPRQRLEVYRRLARISTPAQADALRRDLTDRFGAPPRAYETMETAALVRGRLARLGVLSVSRGEGHLKLRVLSAPQAHRQLAVVTDSFRVLDEGTLALPLRKGLEHPLDQLRFLANLLHALARHGGMDARPQAQARPPTSEARNG
jgi:transcription-repair coupling factor (superfamily II helicase)